MYYTYLHCKPDGTPFYVGKGKGCRATSVKNKARNKFHQDIVGHYGVENIQVFIFPCESEDQAFSDEIHQIAQLRREGYRLANFNDGGEGSRNPSQEVRDKISRSNKGKSRNKGIMFSDETKRKMSDAAKKRFQNKEYKENILSKLSINRIGNKSNSERKLSDGQKDKISKSLIGNKRCLGKKLSDEVKMKISESVKKARREKPWSTKRTAA